MTTKLIILFDGVCNLCNSLVNFILDRDQQARFRFAALQSKAAGKILEPYHDKCREPGSVILIEGDRIYQKSTAVLRIVRCLPMPWPLFYGLMIVPRFIRDWLYDLIARNRYRWFGKRKSCRMPTATLRDRFL